MRAGVIRDGVQHAVVRRRLLSRALCGAGRIRLVLPVGFDPGDYGACAECARLVRTSASG
jgi:hypothetical protein